MRRGAGAKLAAEALGRLCQFALVYAAQRTLGPAGYGELAYALALGFVLVPLTDLGVQLTLTRRLAGRHVDPAAGTGAALALKCALTLGALALLLIVTGTRPEGSRAIAFALAGALLVGSFAEFFGYAFRGLQRVEHDAALLLALRLLTTTLGLAALWAGRGIAGLAVAYVIAGVAGAAGGFAWLRARFFRPRLQIDLQAWKGLLGEALPLGVGLLVSIAYLRTAVFVLDAWAGAEAVGLFGVAQKLTEPLLIVPAAILAAVFPAFAEALARGGAEARRLRNVTLAGLASAGAGVAVVGAAAGPWLVRVLYGAAYEGSARPFQILAIVVAVMFVNYALTHFLIAAGGQRRYLLATVIVFSINLGLCLRLVPARGPAGAAAAMLASELVLLALCWHWTSRPGRAPAPLAGTLDLRPE